MWVVWKLQNGYSYYTESRSVRCAKFGCAEFWSVTFNLFTKFSWIKLVSQCFYMCSYVWIHLHIPLFVWTQAWVCQAHVWKLDEDPKFWSSSSTLFELHLVLFVAEHTRLAGLWTSRAFSFLPLASLCLEY